MEEYYKIGRIAVKKECRGKKYGDFIVRMLVDKAFTMGAKEVFVGNLKNETAQKYMEVLATTGYLDLTLSEYQKEDPHQRIKYVFDDGNSKPYFDENNASLCVNGSFEINWTGGCLDDDFCSDDEDEYEENED